MPGLFFIVERGLQPAVKDSRQTPQFKVALISGRQFVGSIKEDILIPTARMHDNSGIVHNELETWNRALGTGNLLQRRTQARATSPAKAAQIGLRLSGGRADRGSAG